MNDRFHPGTFTAGVIFLLLGIAFLFEAAGAWTFRLGDLATLGPLTIVGVGVAVLVSSIWSGRPKIEE
ncbi:MAG: hypothetical protein OEM97_09320 [Acidimicrobiia bacterium]|nr:hypothetical protein [Acidimicrobiia bacterium]